MAFYDTTQSLYQQNSIKQFENSHKSFLLPSQQHYLDPHSLVQNCNRLALINQEIAYYHNSIMDIKNNNHSIPINDIHEKMKSNPPEINLQKEVQFNDFYGSNYSQKAENNNIDLFKGNGSSIPLLTFPNLSSAFSLHPSLSLLNNNKTSNPINKTISIQPFRIVNPSLSPQITPHPRGETSLFSKKRDSSAFRQWRPEIQQSQQKNIKAQNQSLESQDDQLFPYNIRHSHNYPLYSDQTSDFHGLQRLQEEFLITENQDVPPLPNSHKDTQDYHKLFYQKDFSQSQQQLNIHHPITRNGEQINQTNKCNHNGNKSFETQIHIIPQLPERNNMEMIPSCHSSNYQQYNINEKGEKYLVDPNNNNQIAKYEQGPSSQISQDSRKANLIPKNSRFSLPQTSEADILIKIEAMEKLKQDNYNQYKHLEEQLKQTKMEEKQNHLTQMTKLLEKNNSINAVLINLRQEKILLESLTASLDKNSTGSAAALTLDARIPQKESISAKSQDESPKKEQHQHQTGQIKVEEEENNQHNKQANEEMECESDQEHNQEMCNKNQQFLSQDMDQQLLSKQLKHQQQQESITMEEHSQELSKQQKHQEQQKQEFIEQENQEQSFDQNQNNHSLNKQPIETSLFQPSSGVNGIQSSNQFSTLPLILGSVNLQMTNNDNTTIQSKAGNKKEKLGSQVQIYHQDGNRFLIRNKILCQDNSVLSLPEKDNTNNCDNHTQDIKSTLNLVGLDNQNDSSFTSQQQQTDEAEEQHRSNNNLEKKFELSQQQLLKKMQFHNQLKIFMLQCTKFINESFNKDESWYKDESDLKSKHIKYLKFFKNRFTKSDLSYFLQRIDPITVEQLDQLMNQTKSRKQLIAQRRIIFIIIILSSFLTPSELSLILGEESKQSEFLRQSNTQLIKYLINNQDKLILINEHITTVNRFTQINRTLLQQFCLSYSGKRTSKKNQQKLDQFYCKSYVLAMLSNPGGIE